MTNKVTKETKEWLLLNWEDLTVVPNNNQLDLRDKVDGALIQGKVTWSSFLGYITSVGIKKRMINHFGLTCNKSNGFKRSLLLVLTDSTVLPVLKVPVNKRLVHFVYITTCSTNGKRYIGKHSTTNPNDGYLGSGSVITKDIKRFGKDNFTLEVQGYFSNAEDAYKAEDMLIHCMQAVSSNLFYNRDDKRYRNRQHNRLKKPKAY